MQDLLATAPLAEVETYLAEVSDRLARTEDPALARMVLGVQAPLANRLNMQSRKHRLEDDAFRIARPQQYQMAVKLLRRNKAVRGKEVLRLKGRFEQLLADGGVQTRDISGRHKQPYSLWKKLNKKGTISHVHDLLALRVIVADEAECYRALDVLHGAFQPDLDRLKDYIKRPKPNGYRSLHTSLAWHQKTVEVQIRTPRMQRQAESGAAAHFHYDQHKDSKHYRRGEPAAAIARSSPEIWVYVFSPAGDVYRLPEAATSLDFAFAVHSQVGLRARGAKINGRIGKLDSGLSQGDVVEVLTGPQPRPKPDWLYMVATRKARNRIQRWLKRQQRGHYRDIGKQKLLDLFHGQLPAGLDDVCRRYNYPGRDDLYVAVGAGYLRPGTVYNLVYPPRKPSPAKAGSGAPQPGKGGARVVIAGMEGLDYRMASCCDPSPGDQITGHLTSASGVTVHWQDCGRLAGESQRLIGAEWAGGK
ncbi:hypothetical protein BRC19_02530 [Candidatus Saccharibacteria bacterium QS_5_54_17]|nr:MAG: hypothetical protein BRC19_02530 [Candidatus Saccharibacteria bacterium QS_5_54_17]